jgi:hypothetical protein
MKVFRQPYYLCEMNLRLPSPGFYAPPTHYTEMADRCTGSMFIGIVRNIIQHIQPLPAEGQAKRGR